MTESLLIQGKEKPWNLEEESKSALVKSPNLAIVVDEASATVLYVGKAVIGTGTSAATWQVMQVTTAGVITTIAWADGDSGFDNIWDNRASLSYS